VPDLEIIFFVFLRFTHEKGKKNFKKTIFLPNESSVLVVFKIKQESAL